ncbi:hypothetical protein L596_000893 [Steinernema carpocapsae]|uniref:Uncharacterized protein n=1 Tax=Steinernema carpocapsae TaxID=34508 RepID=A0A4U8ULX3_STECR|nr:hypothetical protein L596_000893 [Steinernema carpocapsae]
MGSNYRVPKATRSPLNKTVWHSVTIDTNVGSARLPRDRAVSELATRPCNYSFDTSSQLEAPMSAACKARPQHKRIITLIGTVLLGNNRIVFDLRSG